MTAVAVRDAPRGAAVPPTVESLLDWLGGPTVLCIAGSDDRRTRAVATLLHGNEPSGLRALHAWLRSDARAATRVVCFVGAVEAARTPPGFAHRMLPGRRDLNRCFRPPWDDGEGALAGEALRLLREAQPESLIDLHNNTGHNPAYGVAVRADAAVLNLTALFGERFVCSDLSLGALSEATADDFPTVTIECGRAGDARADATALRGLRAYLAADRLELRTVNAPRMTIFANPVRVSVRRGLRLGFGTGPHPQFDLTLAGDIDRHNFQLVLPGAPIGWLSAGAPWPLQAQCADGGEISRDLFARDGDRLVTRRGLVPIMMTTDPVVALADCLFYTVELREEISR